MRGPNRLRRDLLIAAAFALLLSGCISPGEWVKNGFKVGPNPGLPAAAAAPHWIDANDVRIREEPVDLSCWWTVFQDPTLDRLIATASSQNLSLREAGFRVLEARAQLGIARGNLFPQSQTAFGSYQRYSISESANSAPGYGTQFFDQWGGGFNLNWELDFWGRFRRAVASAEDTLQASCANYQDVMVTLLGDVATNYVQVRTLQKRIDLVAANVDLQRRLLDIAEKKWREGRTRPLDAHQARSNLAQTQAQIPQLRNAMRQASDRLCILLGTPPRDLEAEFGPGLIPTAPTVIAVGIPCDLVRRRPDIRRAQWEALAQGEQIGIAESDLYPAFFINGSLGYSAETVPQLFTPSSFTGNIGPVFQWNLLNYGRIRNNVRLQEARFQRLVAAYMNAVLRANGEAEDGLATFLRAQERSQFMDESVASAKKAVDLVEKEYRGGLTDFNRVALITQNLVQQQDLQTQAHGEIALGLIQTYRALGGGWEKPAAGGGSPAPIPALPPAEGENSRPTVPPPPPPPDVPQAPRPAASLTPPVGEETPVAAPRPTAHIRSTSAARTAAPSATPVSPLPPPPVAKPASRSETPVAPLPPGTDSLTRALPPTEAPMRPSRPTLAPPPPPSSQAPVAPLPPGTVPSVESPTVPHSPIPGPVTRSNAPTAPLPPR